MKTLTAILVATLMSSQASAEILDMVEFGEDTHGNTYHIERKFYHYGSEDDGYKYVGTRLTKTDPVGRTNYSEEVIMDCSDGTWGNTAPTTEDIPSGTIVHAIYLKACATHMKHKH